MTQGEMKERTKKFSLRVIKLVESLPNTRTSGVLGKQLLRSGTSVGANYRAVCRANSTADFISKLSVVEEECDESIFWIELLVESNQVKENLVKNLLDEANQTLSIIVSAIVTSKNKNKSEIPNPKSRIGNPKSEIPNPKSL